MIKSRLTVCPPPPPPPGDFYGENYSEMTRRYATGKKLFYFVFIK